MITIIPRNSKDGLKLSVRLLTPECNTAISLGVTVSKERWFIISKTLKQARSALRNGSAIVINDTLTSKLWNLLSKLLQSNNVTPENIKELVSQYFNVHKTFNLHTISPITYLEKYIQDMIDGNVFPKNTTRHYSDSTIRNYKIVLKILREYDESISWNDFTLTFSKKFKSYLKTKNLKSNTIVIYVSILKAFLSVADENKLLELRDYKSSSFSSSISQVENIYITEERINQLYNTQFDNDTYNNIRDVFVLSTQIGQRYSDVMKINSSNIVIIKGKEFIHLIQQKTGTEVYIPVTSLVKEILSRYPNGLPRLSLVSFNKHIKKIGKLLGWDEYTLKMNKEFYECLSSHTARRSFATNAYKRNIPLSVIMSITGHSTEMMLRRYLKLDTKEKAIIAAEYFK